MKQLNVIIRAELEIPDEWELVDHPSGIQVLKVSDPREGVRYIDFDLAPLVATSENPDTEWTDRDTELVNEVLDALTGLEVTLDTVTHH